MLLGAAACCPALPSPALPPSPSGSSLKRARTHLASSNPVLDKQRLLLWGGGRLIHHVATVSYKRRGSYIRGGGGSRGRGLETSPQAAETEKHTGPGPELLPQTPTLARIVHGRALDTVGRVLPRVGIGPSPGCQPCIGMSRFKVRKRGSMQYNPSRVTSRKPMPNLHPHTSSHT